MGEGPMGTQRRIDGERTRHERGASLVEYALLVSLIAMVCIAAIAFFGDETNSSFTTTGDSIVNAG